MLLLTLQGWTALALAALLLAAPTGPQAVHAVDAVWVGCHAQPIYWAHGPPTSD